MPELIRAAERVTFDEHVLFTEVDESRNAVRIGVNTCNLDLDKYLANLSGVNVVFEVHEGEETPKNAPGSP